MSADLDASVRDKYLGRELSRFDWPLKLLLPHDIVEIVEEGVEVVALLTSE